MPAKPKPATKHFAEGPTNKDAPATSPASLTRSEIRVELAEKHGINMQTTRDLALPSLVQTLIQSRLSREDEVRRGVPGPMDKQAAPTAEEAAEFHATYGGPKSLTAVSDDPIAEPEFTSPTGQTARIVRKSKPVDPDTCKHGEDPVLCESCEDEMLGGSDEDEFDVTVVNVDDEVDTEDTEALLAEVDPDGDLAAAISRAEAIPATEDTIDPDDWYEEVATEREEFVAALPAPLFVGMPGVLDYTFSGHAGSGPSGADRWMNCTASMGMSRRFLENLSQNQQAEFADANVAARQGTTAHAAAEVEARVILGEMDANEAEHELFELAINPPAGEDYTPEMAAFITEYTDLIGGYVNDGYEVLIEERVLSAVPLTMPLTLETREFMGLEEGDDDYYVIPGSVDCGVLPGEHTPPEDMVITAVDLKYGEGKDVDVEANPQIRLYMLGLLAVFIERGGDLDSLVRLDYVIAQPRLGGIKMWTESVNDLLAWRDEVLSPALTAALGLAPSTFSPGESTCQWCPARGGCKALADARVSAATELFTELDDAEFGDGPALVPTDLDNDRLASLLKQITGLTDLQADLKAEAQRRMYRGEAIPGMALYNYTPPRSWKEGAETFFADEDNEHLPAWDAPKLRTPTAFIKAMSAEFKGKNAKEREAAAQAKFARLIEVPDKRPVVGFDGDKRSKWEGKAPDQMFPDLGDDE